ncbi:MAG: PilZ domain-containing protein [candidate division KSB1 bacterium]|nr:PilZ domain-containing protein [candidate division KSB1 bacterium]
MIERRRHPRWYPDRKNPLSVALVFNGGERLPVDIVNISCGGLFGHTQLFAQFVEWPQHRVPVIEFKFPNRETFRCSGTILRVQPTRDNNKCFCAIQFDQFGHDEHRNCIVVAHEIEALQKPSHKVIIQEQQLIRRLQRSENYLKITDAQRQTAIRRAVYDSFDDVTVYLSLEEKYWFFEIIDEMKRQEPNYSDSLKRAFVNLCRTGIEQTIKYRQQKVL